MDNDLSHPVIPMSPSNPDSTTYRASTDSPSRPMSPQEARAFGTMISLVFVGLFLLCVYVGWVEPAVEAWRWRRGR